MITASAVVAAVMGGLAAAGSSHHGGTGTVVPAAPVTAPAPSTTAAPAPSPTAVPANGTAPAPPAPASPIIPLGSLDDAHSDLADALTAEVVFLTDNERFTEDVRTLSGYQDSWPFTWGVGLTAPQGRGVNVAVGEGGALVCLTTRTTTGPLVVSRWADPRRLANETRFGPGPIARCDLATVAALPGRL